jgi:hypothetical protein
MILFQVSPKELRKDRKVGAWEGTYRLAIVSICDELPPLPCKIELGCTLLA